jgi:hypothetical protein
MMTTNNDVPKEECMMNQKTAVCNALISVLAERGVTYELNGPTPIKEVLTDKDLATVRATIFAGFRNGEIAMDSESAGKYTDDSAMKTYVSGLVNNWVRKEKTFNAGKTYAAKNPGSRKGSSDDKIKQMKLLLAQTTNPEHRALIQGEIDARLAEIKPSVSVEINANLIPDSIKHLLK